MTQRRMRERLLDLADQPGDTPSRCRYVVRMGVWQALLWGAFGGFAVEALDLSTAIRRCGKWPWKRRGEPDMAPYLASIFIRTSVGAGLAAAAAASHQVTTVFAAVTTGVAAPLILENMAKSHKTIPEPPEPAASAHRHTTKAKATSPSPSPSRIQPRPVAGADRASNGMSDQPSFADEFESIEGALFDQKDLTALEQKVLPQKVGDVDA